MISYRSVEITGKEIRGPREYINFGISYKYFTKGWAWKAVEGCLLVLTPSSLLVQFGELSCLLEYFQYRAYIF